MKLLAKDYIRGIDFDNDLTKVAKMYMVMFDDGHTGIFTINSLLRFPDIVKGTSGQIDQECAGVILTNPPFGTRGKVRQSDILREYDLGYSWRKTNGVFAKGKLTASKKGGGQVPDVLFIERCTKLLQPEGTLAIVLPDGDLTNQNTEFVRFWVLAHLQVLAVVSLPKHTFDPYGTGVKSCVVIARKPKDKPPRDYPIFFASLTSIGYDIRGRVTYKRLGGNVVSSDGTPLGLALARDGLHPKARDMRNYPLDDRANRIEVYYDEEHRRLYKARRGIPLDSRDQEVPSTRDEQGIIRFTRDTQGRILDHRQKPAPHDQFKRYQDRKLIELHGAIDNDIPAVVEAWRLFNRELASRRKSTVRETLDRGYAAGPRDPFGLPTKRLFYSKKLSDIDGVYRLHPDYWQFRYDALLEGLRSGTLPLGGPRGIATLKGGATPLGSNYVGREEPDAVPFLRIQNVGDYGLILDDLVYITRDVHEGDVKRSQLRPGDILFTITGRLGSVAVVPDSIPQGNINQHIVRIRVKDHFAHAFRPGYVAAFLRSTIMRELIDREQYGTTRIALDYKTIEAFSIPQIPIEQQETISTALLEASQMMAEVYAARDRISSAADADIMAFLSQGNRPPNRAA